ncbi:MAG TPA: hypothetical protein VF889_04465 [Bacteroidota bacterium]
MGDQEQERIQRALNAAKKREIEEKYGGTFHSSDPNLPPELEADWLRSIEEFERQFASAKQTTVRRYIGSPPVIPLAQIPPSELKRALGALLALLESHNVLVHFGRSVSDGEAYRFLTEELLDHEMDDIHIEGLTQNFLYEEFHPDDRHEAAKAAEFFLRGLFGGDPSLVADDIAAEGTVGVGGRGVDRAGILRTALEFRAGVASYLDCTVEVTSCELIDGVAHVSARLEWQALRVLTMEELSGSCVASVELQKDVSGAWSVMEFGWSLGDNGVMRS